MRRGFRAAALSLSALLMIWAGCRTTLMISNRPDPEDFPPFDFAGTSGSYYGEIVFDVPEEVREEEYDIERADIFCDVYADTLFVPDRFTLEVDLYLGLESGGANIGDTDLNEYLATVEITAQDEHTLLKFDHPRLIEAALEREEFFLKGIVRLTSPTPAAGRVRIEGVYFEAYLSRDTSGLLPFFYLF